MSTEFYFLNEKDKQELMYRELSTEEIENLIPKGDYCYTWIETPSSANNFKGKVEVCPFWQSFYPMLPSQSCGFCHLLKVGDFTENGTMLLWDQIKHCGINEWKEDEYVGN